MSGTDATRVAAARRWYRQQGFSPAETGPITAIVTPEHPVTWEANWVMAAPGVAADAALNALTRHFPTGWQVVQVDCVTDPAVEAGLALAGFAVGSTLIEMAARNVASPHQPPPVTLLPVGDAEWERFARLVDIDQREGKRTGEHDEAVAAGLLDAMRRRRGACDFWLLIADGHDLGHGMTARCPNGLGLIENLFTLPQHRGRGLMSGFIVEASRRLQGAGCDAVFLDAHAHDTPKNLYARLGFAAVALTRTWARRIR